MPNRGRLLAAFVLGLTMFLALSALATPAKAAKRDSMSECLELLSGPLLPGYYDQTEGKTWSGIKPLRIATLKANGMEDILVPEIDLNVTTSAGINWPVVRGVVYSRDSGIGCGAKFVGQFNDTCGWKFYSTSTGSAVKPIICRRDRTVIITLKSSHQISIHVAEVSNLDGKPINLVAYDESMTLRNDGGGY